MKVFFVTISLVFSVSMLALHPSDIVRARGVPNTIAYFKKQSLLFAAATADLQNQISRIKKDDPASILRAKESLKKCRQYYKTIEFFLDYFLFTSSTVYNQPNKVEVEEPFMEYHEPAGLQLIEALLYDHWVVSKKSTLAEQAELVQSSAKDLNALLYDLTIDDMQILESIRLELIRIISLGITGFDTPQLKTGITESAQAMQSIKIILSPFLSDKIREADSVKKYLAVGLRLLTVHPDFDSFDRMYFLTHAALPLQYHLGLLIKAEGLELNTNGVLNYEARNLFSPDAISLHDMKRRNPALVNLGQKLFFEKGLSGNTSRSCASCHQPEKYFTDGLSKSLTLDGLATVSRNAPSLFYCSDQYSQFWDGRVKNLGDQINAVLLNPVEMNGEHQLILQRLTNMKDYVALFNAAFPEQTQNAINIQQVSLAISAFLKTLAPFSSAFDRYMQGNRTALSQKQIKGFNLFMGKAQCATCHFAPLFNGLIPPLYKRTELEVLGITRDANFKTRELDSDSGRFATYPLDSYKGAFKTPTVRNSAMTAPYMHNGAFPTLHDVLLFYNKGGGAGMGLKVPQQTLSPEPLKLSEDEMSDITAFLNSLTDTYNQKTDQ